MTLHLQIRYLGDFGPDNYGTSNTGSPEDWEAVIQTTAHLQPNII